MVFQACLLWTREPHTLVLLQIRKRIFHSTPPKQRNKLPQQVVPTWTLGKVPKIICVLGIVNEALAQYSEDIVDGILGADVLHQTKAVLDYRRSGLYLLKK
jgi:hypothetical protein